MNQRNRVKLSIANRTDSSDTIILSDTADTVPDLDCYRGHGEDSEPTIPIHRELVWLAVMSNAAKEWS